MKNPNFAIIIPIYNVEPYLKQCLDSVIHQTYQNLQIILVDDGSTDQSFEIAYEYFQKDQRISIIQKPNGGLSQARNVGMDYLMSLTPPPTDYTVYAHSKPFAPDYIHFLDSDDWFELDCIEKCVSFFANYLNIDCLWHNWFIYEDEKKQYAKWTSFPFQDPIDTVLSVEQMLQKLRTKHLNFGWHGAFKAEVAREIRFIEGIEYEDVAFAFMLFARLDYIGILNQKLLCYRVRQGSITNPYLENYPSYMQDLKGVFQTFQKAKFYNFFYSDCVNIAQSIQYLSQNKIQEKKVLYEMLMDLLRWRFVRFLGASRPRIRASRDPRGCRALYQEIEKKLYPSLGKRYLMRFVLFVYFALIFLLFYYAKIRRLNSREILNLNKIASSWLDWNVGKW
ncbi:glycosyltransferase family 2 protein [Helicobacter pametensis]|uniref:glycosyltransferase family 2 protein n=2 Tax=Helicobacter pametensis TaxID=95149 RepID=UPI000CF080A7|nr:glycosyltransferase family A protein [Helicobacter pametensis]